MEQYKEYVLELKFKNNPIILDKLGKTTFKLLDSYFVHWEVSNGNMLKVWNDDKTFEGFFTYFRFGARFKDLDDKEALIKFVRNILEMFPYLEAQRLGFRIKRFVMGENSFDELKDLYKENLVIDDVTDLMPSGVSDIDYAFTILLKHKNNKVNVSSGPMEKDQAKIFFKEPDNLKDSGVFLDTDYYREFDPNVPIKLKEIKEFLDSAEEISEEISENLIKKLGLIENGH
jgi:hypothetical protein